MSCGFAEGVLLLNDLRIECPCTAEGRVVILRRIGNKNELLRREVTSRREYGDVAWEIQSLMRDGDAWPIEPPAEADPASELSWWIESGARRLHEMVHSNEPLNMPAWLESMRDLEDRRTWDRYIAEHWAKDLGGLLGDLFPLDGSPGSRASAVVARRRQSVETLRWVWETIVANPFAGRTVRDRLLNGGPGAGPFEVLPTNTVLVILFKPALAISGSISEQIDWNGQFAIVRLRAPLKMRPVRRGRLECAFVACDLWMFVDSRAAAARVADRLRVRDPADVEVHEAEVFDARTLQSRLATCVVARAKSLNHAYGMASARFETDRISHGGGIYEHVFHLEGDRSVSLGQIREGIEYYGRTPEEALRRAHAEPLRVAHLRDLLGLVQSRS